jgi:hypothetical protein
MGYTEKINYRASGEVFWIRIAEKNVLSGKIQNRTFLNWRNSQEFFS